MLVAEQSSCVAWVARRLSRLEVCLSSPVQNRGNDARTTTTVQNRDYRELLLIACIGDHIIANDLKTEGAVVRSGRLCPVRGNATKDLIS